LDEAVAATGPTVGDVDICWRNYRIWLNRCPVKEWIFNALLIGPVLFGFWASWRVNAPVVAYIATPFIVFIAVTCCSMAWMVVCFKFTRLKAKSLAFLNPLFWVSSCALIYFANKAEFDWGAPRLKSFSGGRLHFENGATQNLSIIGLSDPGESEIRSRIGKRMRLKDVRGLASVLVIGGLAANGGGHEYEESRAKERRYGIWGGGSYEKDLQTLSELRERLGLGDEAVEEELSE
jgi:hypothetical protein